jgi:hypothetical protein
MKKKTILITGSHRSGSTWVGRVIESCGEINYFSEPLNPEIEVNNYLFNYKKTKIWFPAIQFLDEKHYYDGFEKIIKSNYGFLSLMPESVKELKFSLKLIFKFFKKKRVLLKDPIALFSSEWLHKNFNTDNIILIRRPEAFISSLKKNKWSFNFDDLLKQERLIDDFFPEYKNEITLLANKNDVDIIDQGILLWNVFHSYILKMKVLHPNWYFVKHEALSLYPQKEFKKIFNYLNIDFNDKVKKYLSQTTNSENPTERESGKVHLLHRNSKENIYSWKNRLSDEEITRIKKGTNLIFEKLYPEIY